MKKLKFVWKSWKKLNRMAASGVVMAQYNPSGAIEIPRQTVEQFSITSIGEFAGALLSLGLYVSGILFFGSVVMGGFQWIISGGEKSKVEAARGRIMSAFTGLAIVAVSYAVIRVIENFFGISIMKINLPLPYG